MARQISGYSAYRSTEMAKKTTKRTTLAAKKTYETYCSHCAFQGRLCSSTETMPVPMLTANHLARGRFRR